MPFVQAMSGEALLQRPRATPDEAIARLTQMIASIEKCLADAAAANQQPPRKEKSGPAQMEMHLRLDEQLDIKSEYARCKKDCGVTYSIANKHTTCKMRNAAQHRLSDDSAAAASSSSSSSPSSSAAASSALASNPKPTLALPTGSAPASAALTPPSPEPEFIDAITTDMHSIKCDLKYALKAECQHYVTMWLRYYVIQQHLLLYVAGPMTNGYLVQKLQLVCMAEIDRWMPNFLSGKYEGDSLQQQLGRNVTMTNVKFKEALVSCARENNGVGVPEDPKHASNPLRVYCRHTFLADAPLIQAQPGSLHHLSGTSLQERAKQWQVNHEQMHAVLVWKRTKYWVSRELEWAVARIPMFASQKPALMQPIRSWLHTNLTCAAYLEEITCMSDEQLEAAFLAHISKPPPQKQREEEEKGETGTPFPRSMAHLVAPVVGLLSTTDRARADATRVGIS